MPFPFTFSLSIPSSSNPFLANAQTETPAKSETQMPSRTVRHDRPGPRRRPSPVPSIPPVPLSRKRGWEPTISQPSLAATSVTSGSGYLDTPAKYREMSSDYGHDHTSQSRERLDREIEDMAAGEYSPFPICFLGSEAAAPLIAFVNECMQCTCLHRVSLPAQS